MGQVLIKTKQKRVRCSDDKFLWAVKTSKTYQEISNKTGQKLQSTIARYGKIKKDLQSKGIALPALQKTKTRPQTVSSHAIKIANKLKKHHKESA